jgi:hypothetical protein
VQQAASGIGRRNLRGRCGGSRVGKRKPPHPRHDEPFRALASVRGRRRSTKRKKRRAPLDCKATSRWEEPSDEESTAGDQRGERTAPATRRVPGRWKASWLPRRHSPSRGKPRRGPRSVRHAEGTPPFRSHAARRPRGARLATEEGSSRPPSRLVREGDGVPSLRANRPMLAYRHCLTHPRRNRRWTRGAASHAAPRGAVAFGAPPPGRLVLPRRRYRWCGSGSLPAFSRKREGYRMPRASKEAHGKRGPTHRHGLILGGEGPPAEASEDRTLEVVLARR